MVRFNGFVMRRVAVLGVVGALAACQPVVPDSGAGVVNPGRGVGFDSQSRVAEREAALTTSTVQAPPAVGTQALPSANGTPRAVRDPQGLDAELSQIADQNDATAARANSGQQVVNASPSNAAPTILNNPGISDENDFGAVAARQSIESDAARIEANRSQYQVVQPTALPSRADAGQPNVVQYALQTQHARGTRVHRRSGLVSASRTQRNCAEYASADEAQIDFLARGGPSRDRRGLDPDGDGYACGWDPAPFRRVSGG